MVCPSVRRDSCTVSRTAKRNWDVDPADLETLSRSLMAVQAIGAHVGGVVQIACPHAKTGGKWLFQWQDLDTDDEEPLRPQWKVDLEDGEGLQEAQDASELITEFLGGAVTMIADRPEQDGSFRTVGWAFRWQSYTPSRRQIKESAAELAEPEANGTEPAVVAG